MNQNFLPIHCKDGFIPEPEFRVMLKSSECKPHLFYGAAKTSPMMKWNRNFFKSYSPDTTITVELGEQISPTREKKGYGGVEFNKKQIKLSDYIAHLELDGNSTQYGYGSQLSIQDFFPDLLQEIQLPKYYPTSLLTQCNIWLGPSGTRSYLHQDTEHNLFMQIEGQKSVWLVAPEYSEKCSPVGNTFHDRYSSVDVTNPDLNLHPNFTNVPVYHAVVNPGDVLYIPPGWWHDVRSLSPSVSFNFWWVDRKMLIKLFYAELKYYLRTWNADHLHEPENTYRTTIRQNISHRIWKYL